MSHSFAADAETEYFDAIEFYEGKRAGLGAALIEEFERVVRLAEARPDTWKLVHPSGVRCIGLARFPYSVFYRVRPDGEIQVMAFAHHRRSPGYWFSRVGP